MNNAREAGRLVVILSALLSPLLILSSSQVGSMCRTNPNRSGLVSTTWWREKRRLYACTLSERTSDASVVTFKRPEPSVPFRSANAREPFPPGT